MQRRDLALFLLAALAACKSTPPPSPPGALAMPDAPSVRLDAPPAQPTPPRAPQPPSYSLPKPTDVDWRAVWREDFANDGQPATLPKDLGPVAIVMPSGAKETSRIGVVSSLLSVSLASADHGQFQAATLAMNETAANVNLNLGLIDPIGRWVHSAASKDPAVKSVFVVRVYEHATTSRDVVKFDIAPRLQALAEYNDKAVAYNAKRAAHLAARSQYEADHAAYAQQHAAWRTAMMERIAMAQRAHEDDSAAAVRAYEQRWSEYAAECARQQIATGAKPPTPAPKPFAAPALVEAGSLVAPTPTEDAHLLSLDDMRKLLLQTATEAVPTTTMRLGGQFVDAGTGLTTATIDAELVLPAEARKTEAGMLRELLQRLAR